MKFRKGGIKNEFRRKIIETGAISMHSTAIAPLILTLQGVLTRCTMPYDAVKIPNMPGLKICQHWYGVVSDV